MVKLAGRHPQRGIPKNAWIIVLCVTLLLVPAGALPENTVPAGDSLQDANHTGADRLSTGTDPGDRMTLPDNLAFPSIAYDNRSGTISKQYRFSFQQQNISIQTNVSIAVYNGAKKSDKYVIAPPDTPKNLLAAGYYRAFADDPRQEPFYADLLNSFRALRAEHRYSDDEYLELIAAFVQSLPYDNETAVQLVIPPRFPVETAVEGTGDCDDKSVLLAGLLSREGYDVALLYFAPEHHMAVGIRNQSMSFHDTGYLYLETTSLSYIGAVPSHLLDTDPAPAAGSTPVRINITSTPLVIRIGSGEKHYTSAAETAYILEQKDAADAKVISLKAEIKNLSRMNQQPGASLIRDYNRYAEIHNFIVIHKDDRAGTYRYLRLGMTDQGQPLPAPVSRHSLWDAGSTCPGSFGTGTVSRIPLWCLWQNFCEIRR